MNSNEMCGCGTEGKTSSAKGLVRINYKEDFELVVELLAGDKPYKLGDEDFRIDFIVMASRYTVGRTAGVCERCSVDGNKIRCFMDAHGLPPGELRAEVKVNTPDPNYADGKRLSIAIAEGTVVLVKDNTRFDGAVIKANIPVALVDAYQLAKAHGYKGTIDEYYATFTEIGHLKENIKGTLDEMTEAEKQRANAEKERAKAETERQRNQDSLNTAEDERVKNEQQRQDSEGKRQQAELNRFTAEDYRVSAEVERLNAEKQRNSTEQARNTAESQRSKDELARVGSEIERAKAEKQRQTDEDARQQAEDERQKNRNRFNAVEEQRVKSEQQRNVSEEARKNAETERATAEDARNKAEKDRATAESNRANAEIERAKAEQQRSSTDELWKTAEQQRTQAETQRQTAEEQRKQAEEDRQKSQDRLNAAEEERKQAEADRQKNRNRFNAAEDARVDAEKQRNDTEQARKKDEKQRLTNEDARQKAEKERATAEGKRANIDKERNELVSRMQAAWQEIERMKKVREGEYGKEIELVEKIKNAAKIPTQNVWLDATDGQIKSSPASEGINANAYKYYYIGRREVVGKMQNVGANKYVTHLDLTAWNVEDCTDASWMLAQSPNLQTVAIGRMPNVINIYRMLFKCPSLLEFDANGWNCHGLTEIKWIFDGDTSLRRVDFRSCSFHNVPDANGIFSGCTGLVELWLPMTFDLLSNLNLWYTTVWGATPEGLASLRWTFGDGADDRTAKGLQPCTVRLGRSVYDRLTDNERAAAAKKGWTITK